MRKLTHKEIISRQRQKMNSPRLDFSVVLNNIRSLHNVGSIFRSADGVGVKKIWLCGITGYPPNHQISKTALGAEGQVPWEYQKDAISVIKEHKDLGCQIVLLEQLDESQPFESFKPEEKICLVIGNEIEGVSEKVVQYCDQALEIEMRGLKNSLNVSVAFGIVAYHIRNKLKQSMNKREVFLC